MTRNDALRRCVNSKAETSAARANGTFCWPMLSFQSPFEENQIWINCKAPIFFLLKIFSFLIIRKNAENLTHL